MQKMSRRATRLQELDYETIVRNIKSSEGLELHFPNGAPGKVREVGKAPAYKWRDLERLPKHVRKNEIWIRTRQFLNSEEAALDLVKKEIGNYSNIFTPKDSVFMELRYNRLEAEKDLIEETSVYLLKQGEYQGYMKSLEEMHGKVFSGMPWVATKP